MYDKVGSYAIRFFVCQGGFWRNAGYGKMYFFRRERLLAIYSLTNRLETEKSV